MILIIFITILVSVIFSVVTTIATLYFFNYLKQEDTEKKYQQTNTQKVSVHLRNPDTQYTRISTPYPKQENIRQQYVHPHNSQPSEVGNNTASSELHTTDSVNQTPIRVYQYLMVNDGNLILAVPDKTAYYRSWKNQGKTLYEFHCKDDAMKKAIRNHSAIVDPCCDRVSSSKDFGTAKQIKTIEVGELDNNNGIIKKTKVQFI